MHSVEWLSRRLEDAQLSKVFQALRTKSNSAHFDNCVLTINQSNLFFVLNLKEIKAFFSHILTSISEKSSSVFKKRFSQSNWCEILMDWQNQDLFKNCVAIFFYILHEIGHSYDMFQPVIAWICCFFHTFKFKYVNFSKQIGINRNRVISKLKRENKTTDKNYFSTYCYSIAILVIFSCELLWIACLIFLSKMAHRKWN